MALQGPFSRPIQALRTLFDITGEKAYPQNQADFVQPTVDVQRFAAGPFLENTGGPVTALTGNATSGFQVITSGTLSIAVPAHEAWLLYELTSYMTASVLAGEFVRGRAAVSLPTAGAIGHAIMGAEMTSSLVEAAGFGCPSASFVPDNPIWLPPGSLFGFFQEHVITAGTISVNVSARWLRIRL